MEVIMKPQIYFWKPQVTRFIELNNRVLKIYKDTKIDKDILWNKYKKEAEENISKASINFNPEYHDVSDLADFWNDQLIDYSEILEQAVSGHLYQYITMLCQTWENQLISFCVREIKNTHEFNEYPQYGDIITMLKKQIGEDRIKGLDKITELRLLVNVIKHGEGQAADRLRKKRPDYFTFESFNKHDKYNDRLVIFDSVFLDGQALNVSESDLYEYHKSVNEFWKSLPERVYLDI